MLLYQNAELTASIVALIVLVFLILRLIHAFANAIFQYLNINLLFKNIKPKYIPHLEKNFSFYRGLDSKNKIRFQRRVQLFIDLKSFIPRGDLKKVPDDIKVIIAGSAIQLTFGYPTIYFSYFRRILVYPNNYYSTITRRHHYGEVNLKGLIIFSIANLKFGVENDKDGYNLGLHEMAHALNFENLIHNSEYQFINKQSLKNFKLEAEQEISKMRSGADTLFRSYGATNYHEFFAVAVEAFFECTLEFKEYNEKLYEALMAVLLINPLQYKSSLYF